MTKTRSIHVFMFGSEGDWGSPIHKARLVPVLVHAQKICLPTGLWLGAPAVYPKPRARLPQVWDDRAPALNGRGGRIRTGDPLLPKQVR